MPCGFKKAKAVVNRKGKQTLTLLIDPLNHLILEMKLFQYDETNSNVL